ncbi:MAG: retropepsin-like aspartic protease [Spirochaetales bacterium]|nr:retropepsin-like aspartic protease [Spirochaetales bacterium]
MKQKKILLLLVGSVLFLGACVTNSSVEADTFDEIYNYIDQQDYFIARTSYVEKKDELNPTHQKIIRALLANSFNNLDESEKLIDELLKNKSDLPESVQFKLYLTQRDNATKLYEYKKAADAVDIILKNYTEYVPDIQDYENDFTLWSSLKDAPQQRVVINDNTTVMMKKDKVGLDNLEVSANGSSSLFIFDTGANLSTTTESVAKMFGMKIIPTEINIGTSTGHEVFAKLALCDEFSFGDIDVFNAVFLVLPDEQLSFPDMEYQIYGILGYPVMAALKEVKLSRNGEFIVPKEETTFTEPPNLAMNNLDILINIEEKSFHFDTGAVDLLLYYRFYVENKEELESSCQLQKVNIGGASGIHEFDGFKIDREFEFGGDNILFKDIIVLKDELPSNGQNYYGLIGQVLINRYKTMTLNFDKMHIKFE